MKIVCISDTHMDEPELPEGDVLIHAGDLTYKGQPQELGKAKLWLFSQIDKFNRVLIIPGNHDFGFESHFLMYKKEYENAGITVLNDSAEVINGVTFYGSPITPWFHNWAFNRHRGEDIQPYWLMIPEETNVLVTHGPPHGILDGVPSRDRVMIGRDNHYRPIYKKGGHVEHVGCEDLLERIKELKQLKLHVFGHVHEGYGQEEHFGVKFVNPSRMDADYQPVNKPIIVEI